MIRARFACPPITRHIDGPGTGRRSTTGGEAGMNRRDQYSVHNWTGGAARQAVPRPSIYYQRSG